MLVGIFFGVLGTMAIRTLGPLFVPLARPLMKQSMKATMVTVGRARERAAELGETLDDLWAEAKQELEAEPTEPALPE
jgi:hypothetical protein